MSETAPRIDLRPDHWAIVRDILRRHVPDRKVLAIGSRATWTAKQYSDLDLAILGEEPLSLDETSSLAEGFRESDLPFKVDLVDWVRIDESFRDVIRHDSVTVQVPRGHSTQTSSCRPPPTQTKKEPRNEWNRAVLDDVVDLTLSSVDKKTKADENHVLLCNYMDVYKNNFIHADMDFMTATATKREITNCSLFAGDVVITKDSEKHDDIGVPALVRQDVRDLVCGYHLAILRPRMSQIDGTYLYYALNTDEVKRQFHSYANRITRFGLRKADIGLVEVPLPPLSGQKSIAHILGTLDDKIDLNRRMNETLEAMARAIFKDWFVDFGPTRAKAEGREPYLAPELWELFPDALDEEGKPVGWALSEIGKEVQAVGGGTPSTKEPSYWHGGSHHWATPKDLSKLTSPVLLRTDRKITDAGVHKISSGLLPVGTVLLSSRAPMGYLAIAEVPTAVNQGFIAMICQERLPNTFVLFWCQENLDYIKDISGGSTFAEISKRAFRPIPVVVPSEQVLAAYDRLIRPLYVHIVANTKENKTLAETRDLLLPKLMSGDIRLWIADGITEMDAVGPPDYGTGL